MKNGDLNKNENKASLTKVELKVCGMNKNTTEVAALDPDYLGFIFWKPSSRYYDGEIPKLPTHIKTIGVFVDESIETIIKKVKEFNLWGVQLHGKENADYCKKLRNSFLSFQAESRKKKTTTQVEDELKIIKVFSIKNDFNFKQLRHFEDVCDYYLFDAKGKLPGGNGYTFDWTVLKNYPSTKPYFLSGGIGIEEIDAIKEFMTRPEAKYCHVIDVNSKFEIEPGLKNIEKLKEFKKVLSKK